MDSTILILTLLIIPKYGEMMFRTHVHNVLAKVAKITRSTQTGFTVIDGATGQQLSLTTARLEPTKREN